MRDRARAREISLLALHRAENARDIAAKEEAKRTECPDCATLRAQLAGVRERVEKLPTYGPETSFGMTGALMAKQEDAEFLYRDDVLAALGGDA